MKLDNAIVILGNPPSKSNCYKVITLYSKKQDRHHGSLGKTPVLKNYETAFGFQFPAEMRDKMHDTDFKFRMNVYYPNHHADLDNSAKIVLDCIQKSGYIRNDNKCKYIEMERFVDKENPRIEFEIIHSTTELF